MGGDVDGTLNWGETREIGGQYIRIVQEAGYRGWGGTEFVNDDKREAEKTKKGGGGGGGGGKQLRGRGRGRYGGGEYGDT
jgi:hypothetical protein